MKIIFSRLCNILTVITTGVVLISSYFFIFYPSGGDNPKRFIANVAFVYAVILGLNYLVLGRARLWNPKNE
jgi:hypothetical protein